MSNYVVDASVGVKWFVPEVDSDLAIALQEPGNQLHVPSLFDIEVANTIWKKLRRGELTSADAITITTQLPSTPLHRHIDGPLIKPAFEIAEQTGRTVYDSLYLALAAAIGARVISADERFINALSSTPWAHLIVALRQSP